ncbi:MAG: alpha/beta hydrolase [Clostridia bacterium]|nr:alpha/beta hydrolase [Clostridia bacterium]
MVDSWDIEIPTLTGKKKRKAYIYLPVGYDDSDKRYPVMYMFDGHNLFDDDEATYGKCWGLADYLDYTETQLIIAAVECNTVGNGRLSEYSPVDFTLRSGERIKGKGKKYMDWLTKTFKPFIDEIFRTLPDRANTAIGGSSMGGLMTIYALSAYNKYFSRGAALSPSLWVEGGEIPAFVQKAKYGKNTLLYIDYGSKEFSNHSVQRQVFANTCACLIEKNVLLTSRIVPGGDHSEASWERQIPYFMAAIGFNAEN